MKKLYISPATDIVDIRLRDGILQSASQVGGEGTSTPGGGSDDWYNPGSGSGSGGLNPGDGADDEDLSRRGGGSVWDNIW